MADLFDRYGGNPSQPMDKPAASNGGDLFERYGQPAAASVEAPALNPLRNLGERGAQLVGNMFQGAGRLASEITDSITGTPGESPGVMLDFAETLRDKGYSPQHTLGPFGVYYGRDVRSADVPTASNVGEAVENTDLGYQPNYTLDRALDNPSLETVGGAVMEQGPAALADMGALFYNLPGYLTSRTQEIAENRAGNDGREGERPTGEDYLIGGAGAGASVLLDRLALGRLLPGGSGAPVRSLRQVPGAAGRAAVAEAGTEAVQEGGIEYAAESVGTERGYQLEQAIRRAAGGALIGGPVGGLVRGTTATAEARQAVRQQLAEDGADPESYSDAEIDAYIERAQQASDSQALDPEQLGSVIEQQTGTGARRPVGEGRAPKEARGERRRVEQELGDLFRQSTDILRRDDVDVTEEGLSLREGALPARDAAGQQANPDTMATRAEAAAILEEMGADPSLENIEVVSRYLDAGIDPRSTTNAFDRARRSGDMREVDDLRTELGRERTRQFAEDAFRVAEARRRRREQGLDREGRQQPPPTPERDYRAGSPREEDLTPRMRQELEARARKPRQGVNENQPGLPRDSVDRISSTSISGVRGDVIPGQRPGPEPGPAPRQGETVDAEVTPTAETGPVAALPAEAGQQTAPATTGRDQLDPPAEQGRLDPPAEQTAPEVDTPAQSEVTAETQPTVERRTGETGREDPTGGRRAADPEPFNDSSDTASPAQRESAGEIPKGLDELPLVDLDSMTKEEIIEFATTSDVGGGLKNRLGFRARKVDRPFKASMDVDSLKYINDTFGHAAGDALLGAIGRTLKRLGLDAYHVSGDEFIAQGDTDASLDAEMQAVQEALQGVTLSFKNPKTGEEFDFEPTLSYGIDRRLKAADEQMGQVKEERERAGTRAERGEAPPSLRRRGDQPSSGPVVSEGRDSGGTSEQSGGAGVQRDQGASGEQVAETTAPAPDTEADTTQVEEEADQAETSAETRRPSTKLYGGIPLDAIADAVKKAVVGEKEAFRFMTERVGALIEAGQEAAGGLRAKGRGTQRSLATDMWRVTLGSLDGDFRMLVGKFDSPTLKSLPDMFHATAGKDASVSQTLDEAVQSRNSRLKEVDEIVSYLRDNKIAGTAQQEQIIRLLENPKTPRKGALGKAADRIEAFLKDELTYLREAGVEVGEVTSGYFPREMDSGKASARREQFIKQARKAYKEMGLGDEDAALAASAYWESVVYGSSGRPGVKLSGSQTPSFVQGRKFSKAAAEHLAEFRVKDIDAVLGQYTMRATKRAEIARRFGDNWSEWDSIRNKMLEEDVNVQDILPQVEDRVALSSGLQLDKLSHGARAGLSSLRTWTTLATLAKSVMPSVGELVLAPVRGTTGNIPGDLAMHGVNILQHMESLGRTIARLPKSERMAAAWELAEDIGIIAGTGHNSLMAARFAGGDPVGRLQSEVLASFFRRNQLEHLTNYTRVTSMQHGQVFMRRLAKQMERHPQRASYFLRELGVPKGREGEFATWLRQYGDGMPLPSQITGEWEGTYRNALQRFTDQTVMRPSASTRPKYASHPLGAVIFQLQAFGYAFQKNVLNRYGRLTTADLPVLDKIAFSTATLPGLLLLVGMQGVIRYLRDELFDPEINERKTDAAMIEGAISQAGLLGVADPYLQSLTGIRYQRNPMVSFLGPAFGGVTDATGAFFEGMLNNSENTNTGERNLADATYDWLLEPLMQAALTASPAGPVTAPLASAATIYAVPAGRDPFTDAVAGKDERRGKKPPIQSTIEWIVNGAPGGEGSGSGRSGGRSAGRGASRGSGGR